MKRKILLLIIGCMAVQTIYCQSEKVIDWNVDLDYLSQELPKRHCNFFSLKSKEDFQSGINTIKSNCKQMTDIQVAMRTQQVIATMGDSHTMLNFYQMLDKNKKLPIHLFWTSDGIHILHTTPENKEILGARLVSINKVPIQTIVDSLSTLLTIDNEAIVKSKIPQLIPFAQILDFFGFVGKNQIELGLENNRGNFSYYQLKESELNRNNRVSFKPDSIAFCIRNEKTFFTESYFANEKIYYIQYNKCSSKELELKYGDKRKAQTMPSFKDFEKKIFKALKNQSIDKIIFDLRFNSGGNSSQGTEFIEQLAVFLKKNPQIRTYVIIGRETFSSAILNAMDFKRLTKAIFVGEETAGKPNHFGEVRSLQLPMSKVYVGYSTKYFKKTDENINTLKPDISLEMSFSDFTKGLDPVFEWIKNQ